MQEKVKDTAKKALSLGILYMVFHFFMSAIDRTHCAVRYCRLGCPKLHRVDDFTRDFGNFACN